MQQLIVQWMKVVATIVSQEVGAQSLLSGNHYSFARTTILRSQIPQKSCRLDETSREREREGGPRNSFVIKTKFRPKPFKIPLQYRNEDETVLEWNSCT